MDEMYCIECHGRGMDHKDHVCQRCHGTGFEPAEVNAFDDVELLALALGASGEEAD